MNRKGTLQREANFSGIGVHSGDEVHLCLKPSRSGEIVFLRQDLGNRAVAVSLENTEVRYSTTIKGEGCAVQTVEHLLASLYVLGVDSLLVELDRGEIPIMDGSATPFVQGILDAGIQSLSDERKYIRILDSLTVQEGEARVAFHPDPNFKITYSIDYDHPAIGQQGLALVLDEKIYAEEVAPARTFGFLKDVARLRNQGLALGGSLENAVVLDEEKVINGPLRFPDEFVRHKILDLIGDLSLCGHPLRAHVVAHKAGHKLHLHAIKALLENPQNWTFDK